MRKNKSIALYTLVAIVAIFLLIILYSLSCYLWPAAPSKLKEGVVLVEAKSRYSIAVGKDTLYVGIIGMNRDIETRSHYRGDSAEVTSFASGFFVANDGGLITSASLWNGRPAIVQGKTLKDYLEKEQQRLEKLHKTMKSQVAELNYYARTHSSVDEGYHLVMYFKEEASARLSRIDSAKAIVDKAVKAKRLVARLQTNYTVHLNTMTDSGLLSRRYDADLVCRERTLLYLRLSQKTLPSGAYRFMSYLTQPWSKADGIMGYIECTMREADAPTTLPQECPATGKWIAKAMNVANGSVAISSHGNAMGVVGLQGLCSKDDLKQIVSKAEGNYLVRLACNIWHATFRGDDKPAWKKLTVLTQQRGNSRPIFSEIVRVNNVYRGRTINGIMQGAGTMEYSDGSKYSGRWKDGKRNGYGIYTDSLGTRWQGVWQADSLPSGISTDSLGTYYGEFDSKLKKSGKGEERRFDGRFFEGEWKNGKPDGLGAMIEANKIVRCGIWRKGRFKGERMMYTKDRVYGIDISKHQHEKGRKRYGINWSAMRIYRLGTAGKGRIMGAVNYPVSYVYIKASQGLRIKNKYYATDIARARLHGIKAGAYHFFSTHRGALQARYFLSLARPRKGDLPPVLDMELTDRQIALMGGRNAMFREILSWMRTVKASTGTRPVLYVGQSFVDKYLPHAPAELKDYDVWIARYGQYKPYVHLLYWQLSPIGRVGGIHGDVDINVFNGTKEQFREYLKHNCVK